MTLVRPLLFASCLVAVAASRTPAAEPEKKPDGPVSYYREVRPLFALHCQGCHQPAKPMGGYVMTSHAELLKSGVKGKLSDAQKPFDGLDLKVLAYIAYLDSASKADIFGALADTDVAPEIAKNVAERLALNGFIRDTGNHYFVVDRAIGELAAPTVEAEIIAWLEKKRRRNGK